MKKLLIPGFLMTALLLGAVSTAQACALGCDTSYTWSYNDMISDGKYKEIAWDWKPAGDKSKITEILLTLNYSGAPTSAWDVYFKSKDGGSWVSGNSATLEADGSTTIAWQTGDTFFGQLLNNENLKFTFDKIGSDSKFTLKSAILEAKCAPVPLPAAGWLFGSALVGIAGVARRKGNGRAQPV
ncbi:hypothetical protein CKO23_01635 [Thiocystis violacea]|nr:hypothetical protein [Thiocystis violacea]